MDNIQLVTILEENIGKHVLAIRAFNIDSKKQLPIIPETFKYVLLIPLLVFACR